MAPSPVSSWGQLMAGGFAELVEAVPDRTTKAVLLNVITSIAMTNKQIMNARFEFEEELNK